MTILIKHADGREIEVTEETFTEVYRDQGFARVSESDRLSGLTREQLNAHAENAGVADPAHYPTKAALIEAIGAIGDETLQALDEQAAQDAEETSEADAAAEPADESDAGDADAGDADATDG